MLAEILRLLNVSDGESVVVRSDGERVILERVSQAMDAIPESKARGFVVKVTSNLKTRLAQGQRLFAVDVAKDLDISVTTLHRNLRREGATYHKVLDGIRRGIALGMMTDSNGRPSTKQLMLKLGYLDRSSCFKALRRWGL